MFADAADGCLNPLSTSTDSRRESAGRTSDKEISEGAQELNNWLISSLKNLEGVHLLPCHFKFSGQASVASNFRPVRVSSSTSHHSHSHELQVLLHGRWLRGQELLLNRGTYGTHLQGFVAAAQETSCNLNDLRKSLSRGFDLDSVEDEICVGAEDPPTTVVALRPYAEFDKLCYWQQDREPNATDDVQQSLFFLRAAAAMHDYQDEFEES